MRDMPEPARIGALAPAELQAFDLAARRALALRHAAREVAAGRIDLSDRERRGRGSRRSPTSGRWTLEMLSLYGQGHYDLVPAGDLGFIKLVGRLSTGHPKARADEAEVRGFFERYGEWKGLAGAYCVVAAARRDAHGVAVARGASPSPGQELVRQRLGPHPAAA